MSGLEIPINYLEHFTYLGVFILLVLGGVLSPISEEFVLLSIGYLIGNGILNKLIALPVSLVGVIIGDNILFYLSKRGGKYTKWLLSKIAEDRLLKYEHFMQTHNKKAIFFLRFIVGLRFLGPMLAGLTKVSDKTFRIYDFLAVLIYVPLLIFIGDYFNDELSVLTAKLIALRHALFLGLLIITAILLSSFIHRRLLKR